jgi:hypothetical protein
MERIYHLMSWPLHDHRARAKTINGNPFHLIRNRCVVGVRDIRLRILQVGIELFPFLAPCIQDDHVLGQIECESICPSQRSFHPSTYETLHFKLPLYITDL